MLLLSRGRQKSSEIRGLHFSSKVIGEWLIISQKRNMSTAVKTATFKYENIGIIHPIQPKQVVSGGPWVSQKSNK